MRAIWCAGWASVGAMWVSTFVVAVWGIWNADDRGMIALLTFVFAVIGMAALAAWADLGPGIPERRPRVSRADKRRIRDERSRIATDAEIRRMEKEAGL